MTTTARCCPDADLAALAVPRSVTQNTAAIRAEYAHIPDDAFRKGRQQVLVSLLGAGVFLHRLRPPEWEAAAWDNLRAEFARWPTDVRSRRESAASGCANSSSVIRPRSCNAANRSSRSTGSAACAWAAAGSTGSRACTIASKGGADSGSTRSCSLQRISVLSNRFGLPTVIGHVGVGAHAHFAKTTAGA